MAGTSLLTLIDDIAALLDDVSVMTKIAAKKTAGVLGDDLALNAEQVTGVKAERELPVVWSVCKGSLQNKLILVPAALLISAFIPWLIVPLLMLGGGFLCFEGFEKIAHKWLFTTQQQHSAHKARLQALAQNNTNMVAFEKRKIKGAIRTDFILSAEIITITLGAVAAASLTQQVIVLSIIALSMTVGVYGLVAGIVKIDDAGLWLKQHGETQWRQRLGGALLTAAPKLMTLLSVAGTMAMFLVGGGIVVHGLDALHQVSVFSTQWAAHLPAVGTVLGPLTGMLFNAAVGLATGAVLVGGAVVLKKLAPAHGSARP
jgi:predicted DNA repair protein MutK